MTTLSAPIVTSSPIATPSLMCTWERMSQERPRIAPSRTLERPMCVEESTTVRVTRAPSRRVTLEPRTAYSPTTASVPMRE
jgi:hypothetical protein